MSNAVFLTHSKQITDLSFSPLWLSSNSQSCSASGGVIVISSTCLYNFSLDTGDLVLLAKEQAVLQGMTNRLN